MITEEEATTHWCPYIRIVIVPPGAVWAGSIYTNRGEKFTPQACNCIASRCMKWRPGSNIDCGYCGIAE